MRTLATFLLYVCSLLPVSAGTYSLSDAIPTEQEVRTGKLPNGLTYLIRKNNYPKDRMEMRLVVNAGSILETDEQQGLAHFVEHMAFNGTRHFEKNRLISSLQNLGVRFGGDLNAYTSFDETVYQLFIPTTNKSLIDTAFLILSDWANGVTFAPEQIDSERGIITEEWRTGRGADQRLRDKFFPEIFYNSQYANRLPIGKIDVIKNFSHDQLTRFYKDWYRPDLMAVIVVGDLDADECEKRIKKQFSGILPVANPKNRPNYPVPDHAGPRIFVSTDKESTSTQFLIYSKKDKKPSVTLRDNRDALIESLYLFMLNERLSGIAKTTDAPFILASSDVNGIGRNKEAFTISGRVRENQGVAAGLTSVLTELERINRFGFTQTELERARKEKLNAYQRAYDNRDKTDSKRFVAELQRHFLNQEAVPGIAFEYQFTKDQLPGITLNEVNQYDNTFRNDSNKVFIVLGPEKENAPLPGVAEIQHVIADVHKKDLTAYQDQQVQFTWKNEAYKPGKVIKQKKNKQLDYTTLTLSNGVKVLVKSTDFKNNSVSITAYSQGGNSLCSNEEYASSIYASMLVNESGIGGLSKTLLNKALAGKSVSASIVLNSTGEAVKGHASTDETETCLQLFNLYFTQPTIDSTVFNAFIEKQKSNISTIFANPGRYFDKEIQKVMYQDHPRKGGIPSLEDLGKMKREVAESIVRKRFSNAADFCFVVVGNIEVEKLKPLLEKYIASLPANKSREKIKDWGIRPPKGKIVRNYYKGKEEKSTVQMVFTGEKKYNPVHGYWLSSLNDALSILFTETLREEYGGVYGVQNAGSMVKYPYSSYKETIRFVCAPERADSLIQAALSLIDKIKEQGVNESTLEKVKKAQKNSLELNFRSNAYWEGELINQGVYKQKIETPEMARKRIEKLSNSDLKRTARIVFAENYAQFVLHSEK